LKKRMQQKESGTASTLQLLKQMPMMTLLWTPPPEASLVFLSAPLYHRLGLDEELPASEELLKVHLAPEDFEKLYTLLHTGPFPQSLDFTWEPALKPGFQSRLTLTLLKGHQGILGSLEPLPPQSALQMSSQQPDLSQKLLTAIIQASPLPIYSITAQGFVTSWNPAAEKIFGFSSEEAMGKILPIVQAENQSEFQFLRSQVLQGKIFQGVEVIRKNRKGEEIYLSLNIAPLYDQNQQATGMIAITEDITRRKQAEIELLELNLHLEERVQERTHELKTEITQRKGIQTQLQKTNQELSHALRIKDEFLANMSHELRTPLTAILGLTELMQEKEKNSQNLQYLETIHDSGQHLLSLINDILDLAKIGAGHLSLKTENINLHLLCEKSLRLVKQMAVHKRQTLRYEPETKDIQLEADPLRLKQILVNLLSNAIKFTWPGGQIVLRIKRQDSGEIVIEIEDTGIGIKPDDLETIFEPFVQLESGISRQAGGTGLGLALVRHLTQLHKGKITVKSTPGKGSCFRLSLPDQQSQA